jgi:aminoglycoside phosphotransferase
MTLQDDLNEAMAHHKNTEGLAIKNTFFRRMVTLLALKTTARFYDRYGICVPISKHKIVKSGIWVHLTEAATMKYIAENTSLPVPKVYCSFLHKGRAYIVMERIQDVGFPTASKELSEESLEKIFTQLKEMLRELRALQPPPDAGVESCVGGSLYDSRILRKVSRFGPFKTIQEFHLYLRENCDPSTIQNVEIAQDLEDVKDMAAKQDGPWPPPVFTHGDLNPYNILVREGKVVGLIDWEFSGWYPHYWEYTSAWCGNILRTAWRDQLYKFLDPFPEEVKMETTRQRWWGEF